MPRYATCAARASSRLHTLQFAGALLSIYLKTWSVKQNGNMKTASARRKIVRAKFRFHDFENKGYVTCREARDGAAKNL
jgi:hypothetical protein